MNISGIRISARFYDYNSIEERQTKQAVQPLPEEEKGAVQAAQPMEEQEEQTPAASVRTKSDSGAVDYAKRYRPDMAYEIKGVDSNIAALDVELALSDLRKDQILEQYQSFVGEQDIGISSDRESENFYL